MKLIRLLQNQFIRYFKNQSDFTHLFSASSIEIEIYTFLMTTNQYWRNTSKHLGLKKITMKFLGGKTRDGKNRFQFWRKKWFFFAARQQVFVVLLSAIIIPPTFIFIFIFIVRHHLMRARPEKISHWNGIIHHCLDLKSRILRIYLPGNDTPTTDKGCKQEILEWAQRTRGFTCLRARVLWLCVNSREGNFYEIFFSKQWCMPFSTTDCSFWKLLE